MDPDYGPPWFCLKLLKTVNGQFKEKKESNCCFQIVICFRQWKMSFVLECVADESSPLGPVTLNSYLWFVSERPHPLAPHWVHYLNHNCLHLTSVYPFQEVGFVTGNQEKLWEKEHVHLQCCTFSPCFQWGSKSSPSHPEERCSQGHPSCEGVSTLFPTQMILHSSVSLHLSNAPFHPGRAAGRHSSLPRIPQTAPRSLP